MLITLRIFLFVPSMLRGRWRRIYSLSWSIILWWFFLFMMFLPRWGIFSSSFLWFLMRMWAFSFTRLLSLLLWFRSGTRRWIDSLMFLLFMFFFLASFAYFSVIIIVSILQGIPLGILLDLLLMISFSFLQRNTSFVFSELISPWRWHMLFKFCWKFLRKQDLIISEKTNCLTSQIKAWRDTDFESNENFFLELQEIFNNNLNTHKESRYFSKYKKKNI